MTRALAAAKSTNLVIVSWAFWNLLEPTDLLAKPERLLAMIRTGPRSPSRRRERTANIAGSPAAPVEIDEVMVGLLKPAS